MRKLSSFMGVLAVGALAVGVSVYAAPRGDGTPRGKSEAGHLVTGTSAHLQSVIDVDGSVAGNTTYAQLKNDYKGLSGAPVRLDFEYQLGGWPDTLKTLKSPN